MCTSIIEVVSAEGMAKRGDEWFELSTAVVAYDHARHAHLGDVITLDFINGALDPGAFIAEAKEIGGEHGRRDDRGFSVHIPPRLYRFQKYVPK